ncbi:MAG: toll/interleukin-1 receptor domain-containing protein, partial [Acidimicrobiales bacterium]
MQTGEGREPLADAARPWTAAVSSIGPRDWARKGAGPAATDADADYCVTYAAVDRAWAEWIAWELEILGHRVVTQAWVPGTARIAPTSRARHTVAVLSSAPVASGSTADRSPALITPGEDLLLVGVAELAADTVPAGGYIDLAGIDEQTARARLLGAVRAGHAAVPTPASPRPPSG